MIESNSTRSGFGQAMLHLGKNKKVVALSADLTESNKLVAFEKKYPQRFFQAGVAEQNMVTMATGMALEGLIPFACSFGVFLPMRCLDQIRISVCYNQANVKLVATHCGLITGPDGATHQALEDVAALRSLPGMTIIEPSDYQQAIKATKAATRWKGPVYLRLHRAKLPALTKKSSSFKIGKAQLLQRGKKLTIIGSGPILNEVIKLNSNYEIINCHTIKPLDQKTILQSVKKTKKVLVIQDHQVYGGLGSAIAELLSEHYPVKMKIIGMPDKFGESGTPVELWDKYGLSAKHIRKEAMRLLR
ncbi:MAG: transketolase family protein [Nanoarchaeota archaeon]|nr:transketolase family protein [Nanoarchaeota archaeon]MBU1622938.1 transketolase family protein [Nanoarchaeota archaeon]MBU1973951.1 transketolase family protein [Nanoarchaeota archaeon]